MDNAGGPSRADQLDLMLTYEQHAHARTKAERDAARAEVAQARAECHALSGALDASIEDYNRMKRSYEAKVEDFARETLRVSALSAENATLRAELQAAQELYEIGDTCVVCHAILEPKETEAPHCQDCVVTDEHEWERQDRIMQLEIKLYRQAHPTPAQEGR